MPGFDGTGPLGQGPMTGQGRGYCVLLSPKGKPGQIKGVAGLQGAPIGQANVSYENSGKEVINMPFGDGTGPAGLGPMTGRAAGFCAGYPTPGYMNPVAGGAGFRGIGIPVFGPHGAGLYNYGISYGMPYGGRINPWFHRGLGRGFGRGWGRGRGRGRFGYWW